MKQRPFLPSNQAKDFLFSFIVTANKVKTFLVELLESIIVQKIGFADNIQIVLVYDGGMGDAITVCEDYRKRYPENIIAIENHINGSLGAARNAGLSAATGRYINFIEPGDKWDPGACRAALDFFEKNPKVRIACFPILLFGASEGNHWLNDKFTGTRVANIFDNPDCVVFDLCSCFFKRKTVNTRFFDETPAIPEERVWLAKLLLDKRQFGLVASSCCRCRFDRSSELEANTGHLAWYLDALRLRNLAILRYAKEKYGDIPLWAQNAVMLVLARHIQEEEDASIVLAPMRKAEYRCLMRDCLVQIDDRIILAARNLWIGEKLLALALKYNKTYEQVHKWVKPAEADNVLRFCRPGATPLMLAPILPLRLEFIEIAVGQLRLRGVYPVLAPHERTRLVLTVGGQADAGFEDYPCELVRHPDLKKRYVLGGDVWSFEGFEVSLPLADKAEVRAFVEIDDVRFDLKWAHGGHSPFARDTERLSWERAGYAVSQLPDNTGLRVASWGGNDFLFSIVIPAFNVKRYLPEAVESVIAQTVGFEDNIQIVLVNDGSTDGTSTVCKRYRDMYPDNIVYIDKSNGGVSSARNAGMKAATGKYINFLDADDKWDPDACQAALDFFEKHPEVNIVCFPIMYFDKRHDVHWLNYKFTQTKVANIFKDTDYVLYHFPTCFIRDEVAKIRLFDERLSFSEDLAWLGFLLIDERNFGVIAESTYRYRKRFDLSSAIDTQARDISYYLITPRFVYLRLLHYAKEIYGEVLYWVQNDVMFDLIWRIKEEDVGFLNPGQKEEYKGLIRSCLAQVNDQIICTLRNFWPEERMYALALKYGMTYEQVKEWIKPDEKAQALCFCRPGAEPVPFTDLGVFRAEFIEIAKGQLLLRGSAFALVPYERMAVALEIEFPDGKRQEYPCKLFRRPDKCKRLFFGEALWALESFEISLPLADGIRVRSFVAIDGIRFNLKWRHEKLSPFVRGNEASYWTRARYILSGLPDDEGLLVESRTSQRVQERERAFLRQVARQQTDTPVAQVARIRRAARRMRRLSIRPIWLISDRIAFAGDNGEALFKYLMTNAGAQRGVRPIFVLSKDSADWKRLKRIGPTVADGSNLHKILFLAADKIISSSADDSTINPFGQDDWLYRDLFNFDFVFLQHGVSLHDRSRQLHQIHKNIALFVTSVERERQAIAAGDYGYAAGQVIQTGLPRHDKLLRRAKVEKPQWLVAVMPAWRRDLVIAHDPVTGLTRPNPAFETSVYFRFWNGLLNHSRLLEALGDYGHRLRFVIHPQFTHEGGKFQAPDAVEIVTHCDYAQTFCEAALLLTDYSSVAFDFALLKKPLVYAQYDYDTFSRDHFYAEGSFEYGRDGFGPVCEDLETTVEAAIRYMKNFCEMEPMYKERVDAFFGQQPKNRCQAVVAAIKKLGRRSE